MKFRSLVFWSEINFLFGAIRVPLQLLKKGRVSFFVSMFLLLSGSLDAQIEATSLTLAWSSVEAVNANVAWGDVDNDGDLDLAAGRLLYRNENGRLTETAVWSADNANGENPAWGDVDNDGDLDLVVDVSLYRNDDGLLTTTAVWTASDLTSGNPAWGDMDGDGDLDLVIDASLYRNDDGSLTTTAVWTASDSTSGSSPAWGDVDNDGDLDLAIDAALYRNEDGNLTTMAVWRASGRSPAWGDVDNDGDLDLAAGGFVYRNDNGSLVETAIWTYDTLNGGDIFAVAWGDVDTDGDLDLIAGTTEVSVEGFVNLLFQNNNGVLTNTAVWSTAETDQTTSVAWGDVDGDGDLDLAVGNKREATPSRLYINNHTPFPTLPTWDSGPSGETRGVAWGDIDGDGDLDLAAGHHYAEQVYYNQDKILEIPPSWELAHSNFTTSIAWGDVDGDGDLDLAVGRSPSNVYRNDDSVLSIDTNWAAADGHSANSVAWGDVDGDGDLDLALGGSSNHLYLNEDGVLTTEPVWVSEVPSYTLDIAWGDVDGDGDLDLITDTELFLNKGRILEKEPAWFKDSSSNAVAWGDYDGDGDLDLAVGNQGPNHLYRNDNGVLSSNPVWRSTEGDVTLDVSWGDYDGDGDLDLVATNQDEEPDRLYQNIGTMLAVQAVWSSQRDHIVNTAAWGDVDRDGDLDLVVGSSGPIWIYRNQSRESRNPLNNPATAVVDQPHATDAADFFSTPVVLKEQEIAIPYTLYDAEGDTVPRIIAEFSPTGGGQWFPATAGAGGDGITELAASPAGVAHIFAWDAAADLIKSDHVVFRIRAQSGYSHGPVMWPAQGGQSFPFRVEAAPWFAQVTDEAGQALQQAEVYVAGEQVVDEAGDRLVTDRAGLLRLEAPATDESLVALWPVVERGTVRAVHDGWSSRTYLTNLNLDAEGVAHPARVGAPGKQTLQVGRAQSLTLFNVVVSVEWDADDAYLTMLERAFERASDYLYDVTDGQMAFGQVAIYDSATHWAQADFQISTKNTVRPYAFVGGVDSEDTAHSIRVGRFWDGHSGESGNWDEAAGYRTLVHEFGHYALYLQDTYFLRTFDEDGHFSGQIVAACTGIEVIENDLDATNASIMYYHYNASELADGDRWNINCQNTEQERVNGEPDWQTLVRYYGDVQAEPRWIVNTPVSRGSVMAGPEQFPQELLPFPEIEVQNEGGNSLPRQMVVHAPDGKPFPNALVALYTTPVSYTVAIDQGLTNRTGELTVYGAVAGDTIQVASLDGSLAGSSVIDEREQYEISLEPITLRQRKEGVAPYLNIVPGSEGDSLIVEVHGAAASGFALDAVVIPGEGGGSPQTTQLAYSGTHEAYIGQVSFAGVGLGSGEVRVTGLAGRQPIRLNGNYNLVAIENGNSNDLTSEDGNLQLHVDVGSLLNGADGYGTVVPSGFVPGPLPGGQNVLGSAYVVRLSGAATRLAKPGMLTMYYHPDVVGLVEDAAIYYWDVQGEAWMFVGGTHDEVSGGVSVPVTKLGIYVLGGASAQRHTVFLPVAVSDLSQRIPRPFNPTPPYRAEEQALLVDLTWSGAAPGEHGVVYDVYLEADDSSPAEVVCQQVADRACQVGMLQYDTRYYWQVVLRNAQGGTRRGPVWHFTTEGVPNEPPYAPAAPAPSDGSGAATAGPVWQFTTEERPSVDNDDFDSPIVVSSMPYMHTQSVEWATTADDDPVFSCASGQRHQSVWYQYTPSLNGRLSISTVGSDYDTVLAIWTGARGSLTSIWCNDDGAGLQSQLEDSVTAGTPYFIEVASFDGLGGSLTLTMDMVPLFNAPVISDVQIRYDHSSGSVVIYQDVFFSDPEGNASLVDWNLTSIVGADPNDVVIVDGEISIPAVEQQAGTVLTGTFNCGPGFTALLHMEVTIVDATGRRSNRMPYTMNCFEVH